MLPAIRIKGSQFIDNLSLPFHYVGVADFSLFKRALMPNGYRDLVAPRLAEWKALAGAGGYTGPIVLRVFRYAAYWNAFALNPWSYAMDEARVFSNYCGEQGFYVDWTCGDSQEVLPEQNGIFGQQQHLNQFVSALVPCTNAFIQTCNEPFKNGIDVSAVIPPQWGHVLRSSGYYSDAGSWDHTLDLDYIDFHPDRNTDGLVPKWVGKLFESAVYLMPCGKPIVYAEPIGADEINQPGRRSNDPELFRMAGLSIGLVAGVTFHSTNGITGDHLGPLQSACAAHFFDGICGGIGR